MMEPKELALKVAKLLDDKKAQDVVVIDIGLKASFADYFIIASGGSERQMSALVDNVEDMLEPMGVFPKSIEGKRTSGWTLMDYGDVVINVMTVDMREKYNLERIWGDCETLEINF
ncbi:MAG: ribosome silencing factor [Bacillota bacterium]|nr:ribosome silencing factor [Bacillota bacterium]